MSPDLDLQSFLATLEGHGMLERIAVPVDPEWEINGISNKLMGESGPAVLFEDVVGSRLPVVTGVLATQERFALGLGLPPDAPERLIRSTWWDRCDAPIPPRLVETGLCQEVVLEGEDADLESLPAIRWHTGDGGTYFGTMGLQVTRHPESGELNVGIYRMMLLSGTEATFYAPRYQHAGLHLSAWESRGAPMPVAVVVGADPAFLMAAGTKLRQPPDEFALAGGVLQAPLDVVRCRTSDLIVPANAEMVLEGEIVPGKREICGPFGEYTGFYGDPVPSPVFRLRAITHRRSPIFQATRAGKSPVESTNMWVRTRGYTICRELQKLPGVVDAHLTRPGISFHAVVAVERRYAGYVRQLASALLGGDFGNLKQIVVVDPDIDVHDHEHVEWAVSTRVDPAKDIWFHERHRGGSLDVSQVPAQRLVGDKVIIDATLPVDPLGADHDGLGVAVIQR